MRKMLLYKLIILCILISCSYIAVSCTKTNKKQVKTENSVEDNNDKGGLEETTFQGLQDNMVFDVAWEDGEEEWFSGNASCIMVDGIKDPLLITAYHLFVKKKDFGYKENVMDKISGGALYDIKDWDREGFATGKEFYLCYADAEPVAEVEQPLLVEDAVVGDNDVAVFTLKDSSNITPLSVSESECQVGDTVYIMGTSIKETKQRKDCTYEAAVIMMEDDQVLLEVKDAIDFYGCNGCPIVNAKGEFVGMLLHSDENYVVMNNLQTIREDLEKLEVK